MLIRAGVVPACSPAAPTRRSRAGILHRVREDARVSTRRWDDPRKPRRPFSADRDGFVLGEGAWMFVLEDRERALARGATILAEVRGYASTCDAYHRVQIAPDVVEPVRAIELALADAGRGKDEVGYVNLHGTGTELNDRMETAACASASAPRRSHPDELHEVDDRPPAGRLRRRGLAATVLGMRDGFVHPDDQPATPRPAVRPRLHPQRRAPRRRGRGAVQLHRVRQ
jgi:3-oxoacyl-[acyl-carrier-protein] synthase II